MLAREDVPEEVNTRRRRQVAALRAGIHHPQRLRPAADRPRPGRRRRGGDAISGVARKPIDRPAALRPRAWPSRLDATANALEADHRARARQPAARGLRRGRGGEGHPRRHRLPQCRLRHPGAGGPRGPDQRDRRRASACRCRTASRSTMRGSRDSNRRYAEFLYARSSATASCSATASAWSTRTATSSPPAWWRLGDADALVTGVTRSYSVALEGINIGDRPGAGRRRSSA